MRNKNKLILAAIGAALAASAAVVIIKKIKKADRYRSGTKSSVERNYPSPGLYSDSGIMF